MPLWLVTGYMSKREARRFTGVAAESAAEEADPAAAEAARSNKDGERTGFSSPQLKHSQVEKAAPESVANVRDQCGRKTWLINQTYSPITF